MAGVSHLRSLQAIETAVRIGSLAGAADALAITPAAVGQRIKALEAYLGIDLVVRGRSGLQPTPALLRALPELEGAFRSLERVADQLEFQRINEIHVAATSDFVDLWLAPRLARFRDQHPNIRFCINGTGDAPLRLRRADCELSFGMRPGDGEVDILFHDFTVPVASPSVGQRVLRVVEADRLEGMPLFHFDGYREDPAALDWPKWIRRNGLRKSGVERGLRFQRLATGIETVLSDAALIVGGLALIGPLVDQGRLMLPFAISTGAWTRHAYFARFRRDSIDRVHIRRFRQWLARESALTREWLEAKVGSHPDASTLTVSTMHVDVATRDPGVA